MHLYSGNWMEWSCGLCCSTVVVTVVTYALTPGALPLSSQSVAWLTGPAEGLLSTGTRFLASLFWVGRGAVGGLMVWGRILQFSISPDTFLTLLINHAYDFSVFPLCPSTKTAESSWNHHKSFLAECWRWTLAIKWFFSLFNWSTVQHSSWFCWTRPLQFKPL